MHGGKAVEYSKPFFNKAKKTQMQNPAITNNAPFSLYFKRPQFFLLQSNYSSLNEIVFTDHPTDEFLKADPKRSVVAVFRVTPRLAVSDSGDLEAYETSLQ